MSQETHYYEYRIRRGESLSFVINKFFGVGPKSPGYSTHLNHILSLNPHIKDPNHIRADSLLRLGVISPAKLAAAKPAAHNSGMQPPWSIARPEASFPDGFVLENVPYQNEADFWLLSWLAERSNYLVIPGSITLGAQTNLLSPGNVQLI